MIVNPNPEASEIKTTNHTCTWLQSCQSIKGRTTVHILQPAKQDWQYKFQTKIGVLCNPEVHPRTIGYWKNQFSQCLCRDGKPQVSASTLEQYLNKISSQSRICKFTGTQRQKFQQVLAMLQVYESSSMEAKLKAQLLALWLNYVSDYSNGYTYQGKTAQQIIQGSENTLLNHQTSKYEYWKNMCDGFNKLGGG